MAAQEIIFITGANTGIGFETVKALLVPETSSVMEPVEIELTSDESIAKAAEMVVSKVDRIDVLINNAGASFDGPEFASDIPNLRSIFNKAYDVNVSGTHVVTATFVPLLLKSPSPRLIFLTSGLSTLIGNSQGFGAPAGWPKEGVKMHLGYKSSKAALNMVMLNWHSLLKVDGVRTWAISPGFLATKFDGDPEQMKAAGAGDVWVGGDLVKRVVEGERDADTGKVINQNGKAQDW